MMANTWQGEFPWQNLLRRRLRGHVAGRLFPPNGYGLYDMAGNVWEWTTDFFTPRTPTTVEHACCAPHNPRVDVTRAAAIELGQPGEHIPRRVIKGGSHLCAPNYCLRYRPAARQAETVDTSHRPHRLPLHRQAVVTGADGGSDERVAAWTRLLPHARPPASYAGVPMTFHEWMDTVVKVFEIAGVAVLAVGSAVALVGGGLLVAQGRRADRLSVGAPERRPVDPPGP